MPRITGRRAAFASAVLMAVMLMSAGCSSKKTEGQPSAAAMMMGPVPVEIASALQKTVPEEIHAIGNGEAYSTVTVESQVDGILDQANFTQGQYVKRGDVLFRLDPRPFQAALDQALANLAKDTAQAKNAEEEANRNALLFKEGIISQDQYDTFRTTADAAKASVQADQAAVETAKLNLGYCTIRSPIDGRTGSLLVHPGNLIKNTSTNLVVINQVSPIYIDFSVPEQYLQEIKKDVARGRVPVLATIPNQEGTPVTGFLSFVNNTVDAGTGTVMLKGTFENGARSLWPGQFVNISLVLGSDNNATVVPSPAVQTGQEGMYVYAVKPDMTVELRPVTVGVAYQGYTVIQKGIVPGEKVVTDGQLRLYPGAKIVPKPSPPAAQESQS
jgi:membrane fusion protein, multidrug efflux system